VADYDFATVCLPAYERLMHEVLNG
jgi:hypothetical protein